MKKEHVYIIAGIVAIAFVWNFIVASSEGKTLSGIFQSKPKLGYSWSNTSTFEPRFFWQSISARWTKGIKHPDHKVITSNLDKAWEAMPGYLITDPATLSTQWTPGLDYPELHATSGALEGYFNAHPGYTFSIDASGNATAVWTPGTYHSNGKQTAGLIEGQWILCLGYEWYTPSRLFTIFPKSELRWVPGLKYDDRHVVTSNIENQFIPFPGYQFIDSTRNIDVVWKPRLINPVNPNLISGEQEGTWVNVTTSVSERTDNTQWFEYLGAAVLLNEGGKLTDRIAGDGNKYSSEFYKESLVNLIKGGIELFKKK